MAAKSKKKEVAIKLMDLTQTELAAKVGELRREIAKVRLETAAGKQKNMRKRYNLRHELARVLTVLNNLNNAVK